MKVILHLRSEAQAIITTLKGNEERSRQGNQIILHPCGKKKHGKPKRPIENHFKWNAESRETSREYKYSWGTERHFFAHRSFVILTVLRSRNQDQFLGGNDQWCKDSPAEKGVVKGMT